LVEIVLALLQHLVYNTAPMTRTLNAVDLFTGIGGFAMGLE
jgi:hypothetical protein